MQSLDKQEFTDEELAEAHQRGMAQIDAGKYVRVTMEELEKMAAYSLSIEETASCAVENGPHRLRR